MSDYSLCCFFVFFKDIFDHKEDDDDVIALRTGLSC